MRWAAVALIASTLFIAEQCFAAPAIQQTIICSRPIFPGLHRLRDTLADDPRKLESVTKVSIYLLLKYCAATDRDLTPSRTEKINQYCEMHSDTTRAEAPIFWETCKAAIIR